MRWTFSDGTTVELGGKVDGPTLLAQRLRQQLLIGARVTIWPQPSSEVFVDPYDAALVEAWLRAELDFWTRIRELKLTLQSPKDIPALPPPPWDDAADAPGTVY